MPAPTSTAAPPYRHPYPAKRFLLWHLCVPLGATLLASVVLMPGHGDLTLADLLYRLEGGHWLLRQAPLTQQVLHEGGRRASGLAALLVLLMYVHALQRRSWAPLRVPLLYLVAAVALGTGLVALLKSASNVDCPWDLLRYGGHHPYLGLFDPRPTLLPRGRCFPAGHASAGYAWVALYFFFLLWRPRWRHLGLAAGLLAGLVFGLAQQLRGAHFASHDLASLALCWVCARTLASWLLPFSPLAPAVNA